MDDDAPVDAGTPAEPAPRKPRPRRGASARAGPLPPAEPSPAPPGIAPAPTNRIFPIERPLYRRLRAFAFDPSLSLQFKYAGLNRATLSVPWEFDPATGLSSLQPGPIGEYLEVIDVDPASNSWYYPVDLDNPYLLAQDGLPPLTENPQFHQQMVYAVAMTTIKNFEHALGRPVIWAPLAEAGKPYLEYYTGKLRIYPHALRQANAYYSPAKVALLFGYFKPSDRPARNPEKVIPGIQTFNGTVFTCLSHDVIAHETTHAILDGLHQRLKDPSNPDMLAFHEAFADIVALFQHFSLPEVLRAQIALTRGNLETENLLGQMAQEFGKAIGIYGALRDALGAVDPQTGRWQRLIPDRTLIEELTEPHARGSLLVAAIFNAFIKVYNARTEDLFRIATGGTGELPPGQIHPDLVNRLATEAADTAHHLLTMCIRGLDYCPPVDLTFGEYLRAVITGDYDLAVEDPWGYRLALVESFNDYGIYAPDTPSTSVESLRWRPPQQRDIVLADGGLLAMVRQAALELSYTEQRVAIYKVERKTAAGAHNMLVRAIEDWGRWLGLSPTVRNEKGEIRFEVNSVRLAQRVSADGKTLSDLVMQILQRRPGYFDPGTQAQADEALARGSRIDRQPDFWFRGGCAVLVDPLNGKVRYAIYKSVMNDARLRRQREYLLWAEASGSRAAAVGTTSAAEDPYFGRLLTAAEPFAFLHGITRLGEEEST